MDFLVLEDNEMRIRWLRRMAPKAHIVWCKTVPELLLVTKQERVWDLILLDHDLGKPHSGTDAARHLRVIGPIVVWSANERRGPVMVEMLERRDLLVLGWMPFGSPELLAVVREYR